MTDAAMQEITDKLSKANTQDDGVSFKGKSLVLSSKEDCNEVIDAINTCKDLQYLNLEGNTLGVEGSKAISKALESKSELKRALWMDMFTGRMKEEIPKALEILGNGLTLAGAQLTELDLSDNAFGPIGVKGLAGLLSSQACYQLQILKLNNNGLGSSGGKMLADALLQCHKNSAKEGKTFSLKLFIAGRNRLENKGAAELAKVFETLGTLEEIRMPQNGIFHKGIKALSDSLKSNNNLKVLDLNDNIITKKGAKHIAKALPHLQKLKVLNLGDCLLRTGGATVLANALADKHEQLEELHLECNEIRSEGGLAVVEAMTNKNKLKQLNVNGNLFGTDGRELLKKGLEKNKRIETLGALSDDDSCDDDEESDEDSDEQNCELESEEENDEENETNGFSPVEESPASKQVNSSSEEITQSKDTSSDPLNGALSSLALKPSPVGPMKTFLENPVVENFLPVTEDKIFEFINNNQDSSVEFYVDTFIPMLVKISSLSQCRNEDVVKLTSKVSSNMFKDLFTWASDKNHLSIVNNALFVHLGLIKTQYLKELFVTVTINKKTMSFLKLKGNSLFFKLRKQSEDKNFKINWDVKSSLMTLKTAISQGSVPVFTQEILKCLLEKEESRKCPEEITIG